MEKLNYFWRYVIFIINLGWFFILMYVAIIPGMHPMLLGPLSVGVSLINCFIFYSLRKNRSIENPSLYDIILIILTIITCLFVAYNYSFYIEHKTEWTNSDLIMGFILLVLILEGTRRIYGFVIPFITISMIIYAFFGHLIPGRFGHGLLEFDLIFNRLYRTTNGYWGIVTNVMVYTVALFIVFGGVLQQSGGGEGFSRLARAFGGKIRGGAAQAGILMSMLFGTMSGSIVANVASTGAFTIPTMKRVGFDPAFAGGVESAASSGGQIAPPVMGAGAFVMAEFLFIPYVKVIEMSIISFLLYYISMFIGVWLYAGRRGLGTLPENLRPTISEILEWRFLVPAVMPIVVLFGFLLKKYPPGYSIAWTLIVMIFFIMLTGGAENTKFSKRPQEIGKTIINTMHTLSSLIVLCVCIMVFVSLMGMTGFGVEFTSFIVELGKSNLFLVLFLAAIICIILGMGMPTVAAYVVAATVLERAFVGIGISTPAAHLFIFYFAIFSAITPPVCVASFTAASIAKTSFLSISFQAISLGIAAFIVPFLFCLNEALLFKGNLFIITISFTLTFIGLVFLQSGIRGYHLKIAKIYERIIFIVISFMIFVLVAKIG